MERSARATLAAIVVSPVVGARQISMAGLLVMLEMHLHSKFYIDKRGATISEGQWSEMVERILDSEAVYVAAWRNITDQVDGWDSSSADSRTGVLENLDRSLGATCQVILDLLCQFGEDPIKAFPVDVFA